MVIYKVYLTVLWEKKHSIKGASVPAISRCLLDDDDAFSISLTHESVRRAVERYTQGNGHLSCFRVSVTATQYWTDMHLNKRKELPAESHTDWRLIVDELRDFYRNGYKKQLNIDLTYQYSLTRDGLPPSATTTSSTSSTSSRTSKLITSALMTGSGRLTTLQTPLESNATETLRNTQLAEHDVNPSLAGAGELAAR